MTRRAPRGRKSQGSLTNETQVAGVRDRRHKELQEDRPAPGLRVERLPVPGFSPGPRGDRALHRSAVAFDDEQERKPDCSSSSRRRRVARRAQDQRRRDQEPLDPRQEAAPQRREGARDPGVAAWSRAPRAPVRPVGRGRPSWNAWSSVPATLSRSRMCAKSRHRGWIPRRSRADRCRSRARRQFCLAPPTL